VLFQTSAALCHMHSKGIIHRDVKLDNVFLTSSGVVKLGDFGVSRITASLSNTFTGTPAYMSPEFISGEPYSQAVDIYALGCMMYLLCARHLPFTAGNIQELKAEKQDMVFPPLTCYSTDLANLIHSMVAFEPEERPTAEQVMTSPVFMHECMSSVLWEATEEFHVVKRAVMSAKKTVAAKQSEASSAGNPLKLEALSTKWQDERIQAQLQRAQVKSMRDVYESAMFTGGRRNSKEAQALLPQKVRALEHSLQSHLDNAHSAMQTPSAFEGMPVEQSWSQNKPVLPRETMLKPRSVRFRSSSTPTPTHTAVESKLREKYNSAYETRDSKTMGKFSFLKGIMQQQQRETTS